MKNQICSFGKSGVALAMLFAACSHPSWSAPANPTVPISFSSTGGGPGSPSLLQLGLSQPIEFTLIGSGAINDFLLFVVKNAQTNPLQYQDYLNTPSVNTISYSINGGASCLTTGWIDGGFNSQDVGPSDSYLYAQLPINVSPGDKITFSSGIFEGYSMNNTFMYPNDRQLHDLSCQLRGWIGRSKNQRFWHRDAGAFRLFTADRRIGWAGGLAAQAGDPWSKT